ncbi:MAG: hypothetical protein A2138_13770 [Deltaproteobacteria bacterium RBG_16_71_12]|nr:MAG: hypothetical protein A2138_13770 [Deltaproteobacteria bacterium RBG_16_71_12]
MVLRSLVPGVSLARSEDFGAYAQGAGRADLERAAAAAGVAPDDVALLVSYRTGAPAPRSTSWRACARACSTKPCPPSRSGRRCRSTS